ncbi:MAG: SPOR domain-containing protein [Candidimonas sp.]|nr:MAG: SPOR domain-containing protein [Candidimonas sp.]TAM20068.1 MAG: SPOR domain-containing protein [Candidimonas sp.]TAM77076.1 MAG: SPOR domain-containing protein [Candidimonas sp.]
MARNNRSSSGSRSGGSTWFGVLAGLIIGLAIATVVAVFVARAPMPFVDHASRDPAKTLLPDLKDAPDPNVGLYGNDGGAGVAPTGPINTAPVPLSGQASTAKGQTSPAADKPLAGDKLSNLIATLTDNSKAPAKPPAPLPAPTAKAAAAAAKTPAPANTQTIYFLQAGAFHSNKEAEATKARILLMGLPAEVQKAQVNGSTINRVRVGPFKGIDAMNRSRARLSEEKITSSVVRQ